MGEEEAGAVEGLMLLWRRLNAEMQRMQASPAARLLDDVLQAMDPDSGLTLQDRQQVLLMSCQQQLCSCLISIARQVCVQDSELVAVLILVTTMSPSRLL